MLKSMIDLRLANGAASSVRAARRSQAADPTRAATASLRLSLRRMISASFKGMISAFFKGAVGNDQSRAGSKSLPGAGFFIEHRLIKNHRGTPQNRDVECE
jgi:hypothetical protein